MADTQRQRPACTVVIPCFNAASTLAATLDSARRQTVRDIEIFVIDDGSTDSSADLVLAASAVDPRVSLVRQANAGVAVARNAGIARASARAIALLDADDLWAPDHLATHLARLEADICLGVSFSPARFIDAQGVVTGRSWPQLEGLFPADLLHANPTTTCSTLVIRRDVFKDVGPFATHMRHNEDQEWLFRVALSGWVLAGDPNPRVDYRSSVFGLAADLDGMLTGFEAMLVEARKHAPRLVARHESRARGAMLRYLARRALRLDYPASVARRLIFGSIAAAPSQIFTSPRATGLTLVAALLPKAVLSPVMHRVRPFMAQA